MGISGLLPLLKSIHKNTTLKKFAGQTIGIDGYGWLHRGAVACAIELALDKPTTKYVDFAMSRIRMLLDFGITPYVVFDGDNLPSKAGTNEERRRRRDEAKTLGLSLYKAGKTAQAHQELQKATGVTPYMARLLIEELKKMDIQYIVAPYEADAQLAYLEREGIINGIMSEDSDLLVFGAKRLITKLNQYGECIEIERADFPSCKDVSLAGWTDAMFRRMAILSGCDYLPNIDKMGLKTAYRFVRKYKDVEKTIRMIAFEGKFCVPSGYLDRFRQAELTFLHHRVFCPIQQKMVFLTDLERGMREEDMPYLGVYVEPEIAVGVACGDLNPKNKQPINIKVSTPARPQLQEYRRQTLGTPSDLKKKNSIDNFFKPQRTPLQELDPNSLTPSPSQQRLLERHRNASWEPRLASSAPQLRRTVTSITPGNDTVQRRAFLARASTISMYKPQKRQRLCSEADDVSSATLIDESPFFSSKVSAMSPLNQRKSRNRKANRNFDVWSDDSVDGILLGFMESQETDAIPVQEPRLGGNSQESAVASDAAPEVDTVPQSSPVQSLNESQGPQFSHDGTQSQLFSTESSYFSQPTADVSLDINNDSEAFEDLLEYHVRKQNEKYARTFISQSPEQQLSALKSLSSPKKRGLTSPSTEEPNPFSENVESPSATTIPEPSVSKEVSPETSSRASALFRTFTYQSSEIQKGALHSLSRVQSNAEKVEVARTALAKDRRATASAGGLGQPTRKTLNNLEDLSAKSSAENLRGSEDALVPDSEDDTSSTEGGGPRPMLNLKNFVFSG